MVDKNECLQLTEHGPTPCFTEAGGEVCDLTFCPARKFFEEHPEKGAFFALHHHCVITDPFDYRGSLKSIQLARIAARKK
jgi:hypothetical protein